MQTLFLCGSPYTQKSASQALGGFLLEQLAEHGATTATTQYVYRVVDSEEKLAAVTRQVAQADLVVLAAPLYIDSAPAQVIRLLEHLAAHLDATPRVEPQRFVAIVNSGFPEPEQNDVALAIYRQFAVETGFVWAGGFGIGGGMLFRQQPVSTAGGPGQRVGEALQQAAEALIQDDVIPESVVAHCRQPLVPPWAYQIMGNVGWWFQARQHGQLGRLRRRVWTE